jgi:hypothetical protein
VDPVFVQEQLQRSDAVAISAINPATFAPFLEKAKKLVLKKWNGHQDVA